VAFPKHGDFRIEVGRRIVTSELIGPWNVETAHEYIRQLDTTVESRLGGLPWGSVVVCRESIQFPLDMIGPLRTSVQNRVVRFNQAAVAMAVAPEVEGYGVLFPTIRGIYRDLVPFEIFDSKEQALDWISSYL
jgi:hypothetical protein